MKHLQQSFKLIFPNAGSLMNKLAEHPNLIVHKNIRVQKAENKTKIRALERIPKGSSICMVATQQCMTNKDFTGASVKEKSKLQDQIEKIKQQIDLSGRQDRSDLLRFSLQIYANMQDLDRGTMPLHDLSQWLRTLPHLPSAQEYLSQIHSFHLLNMLHAKEKMHTVIYKEVRDKLIKVSSEQEFKNQLDIIRASIRIDGDISYIAPIIPLFQLSFTPNAEIKGRYFPHLRNSYFSLEALEEISEGDCIQLLYPRKFNNYELFLRYGIAEKDNPYDEYILLVDVNKQDILMKGDISAKQNELKNRNLNMRSAVKINKKGQLTDEDLILLRILFSEKSDLSNIDTDSSADDKVHQFVKKYARQQIDREKYISKPKKTKINPHIEIIEQGQKTLIENYLRLH